MATHSELLKGLKNWLVGLIAENEEFVTTGNLAKSVGIPFAIVNRVLYEESAQNGTVIEVGEKDGQQAYRFKGTAAEVPSQDMDIDLIQATLSGKTPSRSSTAKKKASTKRAAAKKAAKKKPAAKKASAKKAVIKKKTPAAATMNKPIQPITTTPEFDLDVAALVISSPKHIVDIAELLNVSEDKVNAATTALEKQGLVKAVTMELGDEVTITPTKKLYTEYRRKLDADEVIARYQKSRAEDELNQGPDSESNNPGMGSFTDLQAAILTVAAEKENTTQNDLISETEILYPEKIDRIEISEEIINLEDNGLLESGKSGRTIIYSVPASVDIGDLMLHVENKAEEPLASDTGSAQTESSNNEKEDDMFLQALMETLGIQESGDDEKNRLAVIDQAKKMVQQIQKIKLATNEL